MSEAFTPLAVPEAVAAAHRIYDRVDRALSIRRGLTGVPDSEIVSIVILARQLDAIARAAAALDLDQSDPLDPAAGAFERRLSGLLLVAGYLPLALPAPATPAQEPSHGEG